MKYAPALVCLSLLPAVLGHGYLAMVEIDGHQYDGPLPSDNGPVDTNSFIRQVNIKDPTTDVLSTNMSCGQGAANFVTSQHASGKLHLILHLGHALTAFRSAKPGSTVSIRWDSIDATGIKPWIHDKGPLMTYIASCGGDCSGFDSLNATWVKIDQAGYVDDSVNNPKWYQETTFFSGKPYSMKLPSDLPPGSYLLRHEVISLQRADGKTPGLAEFFPACSQIHIDGDAPSSKPISPINSVSFPGAYHSDDPGILGDIYTPPFDNYKFPGPPVVTSLTTGATRDSNTSARSLRKALAKRQDSVATNDTTASQSDAPTDTQLPTASESNTDSGPATTAAPSSDTASPNGGSCSSDNQTDDSDDDDTGDEDVGDTGDGDTGDTSDDGTSADDDASASTTTVTTVVTVTASPSPAVHTAFTTVYTTFTPGKDAADDAATTSAPAGASSAKRKRSKKPRRKVRPRRHRAKAH